jgi:hypothetical protein
MNRSLQGRRRRKMIDKTESIMKLKTLVIREREVEVTRKMKDS